MSNMVKGSHFLGLVLLPNIPPGPPRSEPLRAQRGGRCPKGPGQAPCGARRDGPGVRHGCGESGLGEHGAGEAQGASKGGRLKS